MSNETESTSKKKASINRKIALAILGILLLAGIGTVAYLQSTEHLLDRISNTAELSSKGHLELANGEYTGDVKFGKIEGEGTFRFLSGEEYRGSWLDYKFKGPGKLQYPNEGIYEGIFHNGKKSGTGSFTWENGDFYTGEWDDDCIDGSGVYTFADGMVLSGRFSSNRFYSGSYSFSNDTGDYTVEISNGEIAEFSVKTLKGSYKFSLENGTPSFVSISLKSGLRYEGDIANGMIDGNGELTYPKGGTYTGEFSEGKRSGEGNYLWPNGAKYEGSWKNDRMNGKGTYYYAKKKQGYKLTGTFKKGEPDGTCTYYKTKDRKYKTKWVNGTCVKIWE